MNLNTRFFSLFFCTAFLPQLAAHAPLLERPEGFYSDRLAQLAKDDTSVLSLASNHAEPYDRATFYNYLPDGETVKQLYTELYEEGYRGIRYISPSEFPQLYTFVRHTQQSNKAIEFAFKLRLRQPPHIDHIFLYDEKLKTKKKERKSDNILMLSSSFLHQAQTFECEAYVRLSVEKTYFYPFLRERAIEHDVVRSTLCILFAMALTLAALFNDSKAVKSVSGTAALSFLYLFFKYWRKPLVRWGVHTSFFMFIEENHDKSLAGTDYLTTQKAYNYMRLKTLTAEENGLTLLEKYLEARGLQKLPLLAKRKSLLATQRTALEKAKSSETQSVNDAYNDYKDKLIEWALS